MQEERVSTHFKMLRDFIEFIFSTLQLILNLIRFINLSTPLLR